MVDRLSQTLRADAHDNRERILEAARALFASDGMDVPVREIARRAGVAPATVYRRFPTRRALAIEALRDQIHACRTIVEDGLADPDPWRGMCRAVERLCELHARNQGVAAAFASAFPRAVDLDTVRARSLASFAELVRRARTSGRLRSDVGLDDLILILRANRGLHAGSTDARVAASRRFAALAIRAVRA